MDHLQPQQVRGDQFELRRTDSRHFAGRNDSRQPAPTEFGFREALVDSLEEVNAHQARHEQLSIQAVTSPESVDPHDLTIAAAQANLSLNITKNVVDRVIQAYREITNLR